MTKRMQSILEAHIEYANKTKKYHDEGNFRDILNYINALEEVCENLLITIKDRNVLVEDEVELLPAIFLREIDEERQILQQILNSNKEDK